MDELRIAVVNWQDGGIDPDRLAYDRWTATVEKVRERVPHMVLCQEMTDLFPRQLS
jgi:hypothetical protein